MGEFHSASARQPPIATNIVAVAANKATEASQGDDRRQQQKQGVRARFAVVPRGAWRGRDKQRERQTRATRQGGAGQYYSGAKGQDPENRARCSGRECRLTKGGRRQPQEHVIK